MGNAPRKSHYPKHVSSSGSGTKKVHWEGPGLPAAPGKPILIPGTEETQPDVVAIRWERSPSNGGSAIIGYLVEHRKLGAPHWVRSAPVLCTFPEMTLSGLEPGWRYHFRIRAQNALGLSEPSEMSDALTVSLQRAASSSPQFDLELKDMTALENEQAEFEVRYTGIPTPKIAWFKDGFEIFSSRRTRIVTENGKSNLLIHRTALDDEGEIKCTATNRAGHVSTKARLMLEAPPRIRLPRQYEDGLLFEQDETIRLKVSLCGRPTPEISWYHDGEIINKDERHVFESMAGESILKIPNAKRKDRGEYSVKATNKLGEDVASFLVTVTDRPSAPGKATVSMTLGRSVSLTWKEPEDDGGCKIGTYIVEYYREGWDMWLKAASCRQTSTTLSELIEGSEYRFRIKAENPYGVSDPSEESDVVFIPDLKRGITGPLMSGKSQSQREIHRGRSEKREVSFVEPTQRTRSLTREEGYSREGPVERSVSSQRLTSSQGRPSRADSRVTFGLDTVYPVEEVQTPPPRHRSKDQLNVEENRRNKLVTEPREGKDNLEPVKQSTTVIVTPTFNDSGGRSPVSQPRSGSISFSKEKSPVPPKPPRLHDPRKQAPSAPLDRSHLSPQKTAHSTLRREDGLNDLSTQKETKNLELKRRDFSDFEPASFGEDDENIHGSSEFMLVLYPEREGDREQGRISDNTPIEYIKRTEQTDISHTKSQISESEEEDLVPPPMSLSLPELFSIDHQVVEIMREAVSSTELLHERAMERFYRAVAVEEAVDEAKRKARHERAASESGSKKDSTYSDPTNSYALFEHRTSIRRKLSNSGAHAASWQAKRDHRRSSDSQTDTLRVPFRLPAAAALQDVASDPNLASQGKSASKMEPWSAADDAEQLRRWHESGMNLSTEKTNSARVETHIGGIEIAWKEGSETRKEYHLETVETQSVETSIASSEEESSDEDLRQFRARIMAIPVVNEEDTYHPRGRPVPHVSPEPPPPVPPHRIPILDITPADTIEYSISSPPISPTNIVPKSILKKRVEKEVVPVNKFGRPIPPEKPIEMVRPHTDQGSVTLRNKSLPNLPDLTTGMILSESDIDNENVISAAEVARNRRRPPTQLSKTSVTCSDGEEEKEEEKMAVVSHYTEIVKEYSMNHSPFPPRRVVTPTYSKNQDQIQNKEDSEKYKSFVKSTARPFSPPKGRGDYSSDEKSNRKAADRTFSPPRGRDYSSDEKSNERALAARTFSPPRGRGDYSSDEKNNEKTLSARTFSPPRGRGDYSSDERSNERTLSARTFSPPRGRGDYSSDERSNERTLSARTFSPPRGRDDYSSDEKTDTSKNTVHRKKKDEGQEYEKIRQPGSRKNNVRSRSTTPTKSGKDAKKRSRPSSRHASPTSRSRNVSSERRTSSRSSSKNRKAASAENSRKSAEQSTAGRKSSRPSSRSSSRDRIRADTPTEAKMERLHRALDERKYRSRRSSRHERESSRNENINYSANSNNELAIQAEKNVRSTVSYVTDVILLMAAVYVYLFKREILAIPIIGLLLYRRIQQGIRNLLPKWLRGPKR